MSFFKQKTAYEMRISDWSSDVCSSDLQDAIMRAAGLTRSGKVWKGCEGTSEADAKSVEIKDLNHDGRPEAIVTDSGMCYGNTGQEFTVLRATPGGWAQMMQVTGIPIYLKARGTDGYHDVMVGMTGTCFGVHCWNGSGIGRETG